MNDIVVAEVFGPTIQGEGPFAGRPRTFLRLGRCNLDCAWCDTPFTWDWSRFDAATELRRVSVDEVAADVNDRGFPVVVTGGEPLLQARALARLAAQVTVPVEVETNGTRPPIAGDWFYVVSPKLASSGATGDRIRYATLAEFGALAAAGKAAAKFVVTDDPGDLPEVEQIVAAAGFPADAVWLMPEGRSSADLDGRVRRIAEAAIEHRWNVSDRLHVRAWEDARGH